MQMNSTMAAPRSRAEITNAFLRSVYNWMGLGLGLTALVAWLTLGSGFVHNMMVTGEGSGIFIVCMLAELAMGMFLITRIGKLSGATATALFLAYSAVNGFVLAGIVVQYTHSSVVGAFLSTAGMFAGVSVYGLVTKRDLSGVGAFCGMGLIGLLIAMVVNVFLGSGPLDLVISLVGVVIFVGLTAYDTQMLKEMGNNVPENDATALRRGTILGAFRLYLDFINLFLMMLRLMGNSRD